jgi:hypothetical protein
MPRLTLRRCLRFLLFATAENLPKLNNVTAIVGERHDGRTLSNDRGSVLSSCC